VEHLDKQLDTKSNNDNDASVSNEDATKNFRIRTMEFFEDNKYGIYIWGILKVLIPFLILLIMAEILVVILNATVPVLNERILPPPHAIFVYAWQAFFPGIDSPVTTVAIDIGRSLIRVFIGFLAGTAAGILVGFIMGFSKWLYRFLNPLFSLMISIPTLAWVPILIIVSGFQARTIIFTIMLSCFFPIVYSTTNGIRGIDKKLIWAAQIMGASKIEIFFDVLLPGSLVSIISGLRLAIGYSWRAVVGAEILINLTEGEGIGYYIIGARSANLPIQIIVGVFLIALGGLLLDSVLMKPLEHFTLRRWGIIEKTKN
jgi:NitT/TauT family transport system permease protein